MAAAICNSRAEVDTLNNELEQRVAERTAQFESANRSLQLSEARKRAVVDTALDCVVTIDHQGKIIEFNRSAEETFGYARSEALGKVMADLIIPPGLRDFHKARFCQIPRDARGDRPRQAYRDQRHARRRHGVSRRTLNHGG